MQTRKLGTQGLEVSEQGLGCMGMSEFYGSSDEGEAIATIHRAIELGVTFLDTADMYGPFTNEKLIAQAIADRRSDSDACMARSLRCRCLPNVAGQRSRQPRPPA